MDYENIPTTVFTPLEYGSVGLSEDKAIEINGKAKIDVFHTYFKPLEWNFYGERSDNACYCKMIVNKSDKKIIGLHYLGPNAGEVIQVST